MKVYRHSYRCLRCGRVWHNTTKGEQRVPYTVCSSCLQKQSQQETKHPHAWELYWGLR